MDKKQKPAHVESISKEVYYARQPIVHVGSSEMGFLKEKVFENERKRVRLCAHKNEEDILHEMFVVYLKETYVKPNKHIKKEESLHILEGAADFVFFDEQGNVIDVVPLGDYASGRQFYCRIPESVYHTWLIRSKVLVVHETILGPFRRSDTVFAPWAPDEGNLTGINNFTQEIERKMKKYL